MCADDDQCTEGSALGACEPTGFCSLPSDDCASGKRYDETAGEGLAGTCVDESSADAGLPDANLALSCADWDYDPTHFDCADIPQPVRGLDLTAGKWSFDSSSGEWTDPEGATFTISSSFVSNGVRYVSLGRLGVVEQASLRITGDNAVVFVSWADIDMAGVLLVNSDATAAGAGADRGCDATGGSNGSGGGGGGGGTAGGAGGASGATAGGSAGSPIAPTATIHGGCSGGPGGDSSLAGGTGGAGGGAVQLTARVSARITGQLSAGGRGGGGGSSGGGGGGGGSGGYLGIEAPQVLIDGAIFAANGGGGGGGALASGTGDVGTDGQIDAQSAAGGTGSGDGGLGGAAGPSITGAVGANSGSGANGGGGGGGGAGVVLILSPEAGGLTTLNSPVFSPARRTSL